MTCTVRKFCRNSIIGDIPAQVTYHGSSHASPIRPLKKKYSKPNSLLGLGLAIRVRVRVRSRVLKSPDLSGLSSPEPCLALPFMSVDVLESLTRRLQGLTVLRVASPSSVASMILNLPAPHQVTRSASSELWSVAFSPEYGGKPFYYDKSSGKERTQWDRPDVLLARDVNVDMSLFGVDADIAHRRRCS